MSKSEKFMWNSGKSLCKNNIFMPLTIWDYVLIFLSRGLSLLKIIVNINTTFWKTRNTEKKINVKKLFSHNGDIVWKFSESNNYWKLTLQSSSAKVSTPPSPTSRREAQDLWGCGSSINMNLRRISNFWFNNNLWAGWQEDGRLPARSCLYFIKTSSDLTHSYEMLHTLAFSNKRSVWSLAPNQLYSKALCTTWSINSNRLFPAVYTWLAHTQHSSTIQTIPPGTFVYTRIHWIRA